MAYLVSHAVCHPGRDQEGRTWEGYEKACSEEKELFAQGFAFHFFKASNPLESEVEMFDLFSGYMCAEYNQWRLYDGEPQPLSRKLAEVRKGHR